MSDSTTPSLPLFTARSWAVAGGVKPGAGALPDAETAGYAAWKSAMAAEKAAAETARRSAELPVQAGEAGFALWKQDAEDAKRAFETRWGVPLGKAVRVQLRGEAREREGVLRVAEEPAGSSAKLLRLKLGTHAFLATQIESVVRV